MSTDENSPLSEADPEVTNEELEPLDCIDRSPPRKVRAAPPVSEIRGPKRKGSFGCQPN